MEPRRISRSRSARRPPVIIERKNIAQGLLALLAGHLPFLYPGQHSSSLSLNRPQRQSPMEAGERRVRRAWDVRTVARRSWLNYRCISVHCFVNNMSGNTTIDLNYSGGEHSALQSLRTAQESPQGGGAAVSSVSSSAKVIISWQTQPGILTFFWQSAS